MLRRILATILKMLVEYLTEMLARTCTAAG